LAGFGRSIVDPSVMLLYNFF